MADSWKMLFYLIIVLLIQLSVLVIWWRNWKSWGSYLVLGLGWVGIAIAGWLLIGVMSPLAGFRELQLPFWVLFIHTPFYLLAGALLLRRQLPCFSILLQVLVFCILLIGLDGVLIEPVWLEVTHHSLVSEKIEAPLRIALLADIQTDSVGRYEHRALSHLNAEAPDLVLYAGDYLQVEGQDQYLLEVEAFRDLVAEMDPAPSLGSYAVAGNMEVDSSWQELFRGTSVLPVQKTTTFDLGPVVLTGIAFRDSANSAFQLDGMDGYHIVLGHEPNFALGQVDADLLLAGHTHGGQIQLPFLGPIVTLSHVPRSWASGLTQINPDTYLYVSRGIGREHHGAPRIRFLCRPELAIIDLVPSP